MFKRVVLFVLTNLAVLLLLSVVWFVIRTTGIVEDVDWTYLPLAIFSVIFGFAGSVISLLISKWVAKRATGAQVITHPRNETEAWLLATVQRQAAQAGIGMPEVAIYDSAELNAFATGPSRNNSLVAVSSGLLRSMRREEVEAVLAHEVSHAANGDMVTLTLIQGVVNTFVIFFSRVVGNVVDGVLSRGNDRRGRGMGYFLSVFVAEIVLGVLATVIVMAFSRWREYRADAGAANMVGAPNMIAALQRLGAQSDESSLPESVAAFGIKGGRSGFLNLFRTHPPIAERIAALQSRGRR
ncbi:MAG: protease HtpX [Polyangiaceae bacterium]